jgi:hypothetical protein
VKRVLAHTAPCGTGDLGRRTSAPKGFCCGLGRERYSPGSFVSVEKTAISGNPDLPNAGTSHVERKNGTLRQWCKRLTRLTYAFSKKWDNLKAALALHFAHYNFCRIDGSLRITPVMATGISDHVWEIEELIGA